MEKIVEKAEQREKIHVVSNPEFLEEGKAVQNIMNPDRVVIGLEKWRLKTDEVFRRLEKIYNFCQEKIIRTDVSSAELSKLASNAFLMSRVTSINALTELCEQSDADVAQVAKIVGADSRIGPSFLRAGLGVGGYCLVKDTACLVYILRSKGLDEAADFWERQLRFDEYQKRRFGRKIIQYFDGCLHKKVVLVLGNAYKADSDDCRNSPVTQVL